jgi:RNase H-like domain found in reverse transcriptase
MGNFPSNMIRKLDAVFARFRQHNLRMHPAKCRWVTSHITFLGHVLTENGISPDPAKFDIIQNFPVPTTQKKTHYFLGLAYYYRRFVKNFSQISAPLRALLKVNAPFCWTPECRQAFEQLSAALLSPHVVGLPDFNRPFLLTTDASTFGIAHILSQRDNGGREHVIGYGDRGLRPIRPDGPLLN